MTKKQAILAEVVQFVPVITLASSFIVTGGVDLNRAASLFLISGIIAALITGVLLAKKVLLNPILLGTNIWLVLGALAFSIPIAPLAEVIGQLQAAGLYVSVLIIAVVFTFSMPTGFVGMKHDDPSVIRKLSFFLLGLAVLALVWSFVYIEYIRLGGALPFIVLNVTRRMMIRRSR